MGCGTGMRWPGEGDGLGRRPVDTVSAASSTTHSPRPPGVDDAGVGELLELLGGVGQRLAGGGRGRGEDVAGAGAVAVGARDARRRRRRGRR